MALLGRAARSHSEGSAHSLCTSLSSEWSVDLWLWVKLLFVPTLGILILTMFLLEESVGAMPACASTVRRTA